jgi:hypothetical protein
MKPTSIEPETVEAIALDFDRTADICRAHADRTGAAAFRTYANRIRRAAGLSEVDPFAPHSERP